MLNTKFSLNRENLKVSGLPIRVEKESGSCKLKKVKAEGSFGIVEKILKTAGETGIGGDQTSEIKS